MTSLMNIFTEYFRTAAIKYSCPTLSDICMYYLQQKDGVICLS